LFARHSLPYFPFFNLTLGLFARRTLQQGQIEDPNVPQGQIEDPNVPRDLGLS